MEERTYTTQTDLNRALVRLMGGGLSSIITLYTRIAAAGAFIFCVANTSQHKPYKYGLRATRSSTNKTKGSVPFNSITAIILIIFALTSYADPCQNQVSKKELIGTWIGNSRAAHAIYGEIVITDKTIAWGGEVNDSPYCQTT